MKLEANIKSLFKHKKLENDLSDSIQLDEYERDALNRLSKIQDWIIPLDFLIREYDIILLLNKSAFAYFLPRFMITSLRHSDKDILAMEYLLSSLDFSGDPTLWTSFVTENWCSLTKIELDAVQQWIEFLEESGTLPVDNIACSRIKNTLKQVMRR